jgi:hypothetical protein
MPPEDERPLKDLFSELTDELRTLLQKELELAKTEVQEQASRAAKAGALFGGGAGAGYFALLLLSFAAAWGLAELIPTPLGFVVVGLVYAIVAAVLFARGRRQAKTIKPPTQAVQTIKQDVQVAKESLSRGASGDAYPDPWRSRPWDNPRR